MTYSARTNKFGAIVRPISLAAFRRLHGVLSDPTARFYARASEVWI
jgi:hypothetical protein